MAELKQFKCLTDMKKFLSELGDYKARPVIRGKHATLYEDRTDGKYRTVMGVRICDYKFSIDEKLVLPDRQMGLSFSAKWSNLEIAYGMYAKKSQEKTRRHTLDTLRS